MPEMFASLHYGVVGKALKNGVASVSYWNPRDWGIGAHRQVDDKPYGGGPGMVMMYEPLKNALTQARRDLPSSCRTIYLSPEGRSLRQSDLNNIVKNEQGLLFIAGRYEGIDERIVTHEVDEEWSIGDFVLSGGELAAMVFIDAIIRLLPGSLGDSTSAQQDSFMDGVLDFPHYTRPLTVNGLTVPDVLVGGHHQTIKRWRRKQALGKTWLKRPDLLNNTRLSTEDNALLIEFKQEHHQE